VDWFEFTGRPCSKQEKKGKQWIGSRRIRKTSEMGKKLVWVVGGCVCGWLVVSKTSKRVRNSLTLVTVCAYLSTACIPISRHMQTHTTYTYTDTNVTSALRTSAHELIELTIGIGGVVVLTPILNRQVHTHTHTHTYKHYYYSIFLVRQCYWINQPVIQLCWRAKHTRLLPRCHVHRQLRLQWWIDEANILPEEQPKAIVLQDECDRRSRLVKTS
jgi:hypothetical protein